MRRPLASAAVLLLMLSACASGDEGSAVPVDPGPDGSGDSSSGELQPISVFGNGRAVHAASTSGTATVVATTIGLNTVDERGVSTIVETGIDVPAFDVVVSPDGSSAMVEGSSGSEWWSLGATPTLVARFEVPTRGMFTTDGTTLVTSSLLQVTTSAVAAASPRTVIEAPAGTELGGAAMTPDGSLIAVPLSGDTADLITYTESTGASSVDVFVEPERKIQRAEFGVRSDQFVLEVSSGDPFASQLAAWDPATGLIRWESAGDIFGPTSLWDVGADGNVLTADGSTLRLIGRDGQVSSGWQVGETATAVTGIVATANGFAVGLADSTLLFTDAEGNPTAAPVPVGRHIMDLEPLTATDGALVVDGTGVIRAWSSDGTLLHEQLDFRGGAVNQVAFSSDDARIAAASSSGVVIVTDIDGSTTPMLLEQPEGNVDSVAFAADGLQLVSGVGERLSDVAFDDTVTLWNLADGVRTAEFGGEGEDVNGCANFRNTVTSSPRGDLFATTSHDFTVNVHRADTGEIVTTLPAHLSSVLDVVFSPTGDRLVTTSDDGAVKVWSTDDFTLSSEHIGPPGGYWSAAFMPDGDSLVVSDLTGTMRRIDVATGAEIVIFQGSTTRTGRLAVSPDGSIVAAATDGNAIGVWSAETGALVSSVSGHRSPVTSAAFSSDGTTLLTGSDDATVRTWRVG